ncbi:unnamed protein product [Rotaria sordida]|uniref:VCBS repeat-containing protein n=1 Tax=Rotaria sordida TaxID=392033 RepID=A0A815DNU5_9BILA|nr:unnamed protein product [Rotaria sordida]CAF3792305.1 unnamed protein product [Rotaria sordida]
MTYLTGSTPQFVAVGDFNNDTLLDIVTANYGSSSVSILVGYGNGSFASQMTYLTDFIPQSVTVGDFNNDTRSDIVVASLDGHNICILLCYDSGALANESTFASGDGSRLRGVDFFDFNNDSLLDIVVANDGTNNIGVVLGLGNGNFRNQMMFSMGLKSHPYSIAIGDFNKDGQADIAVANHGTKNVGLLLGDGNGMFENQNIYGNGSDFAPLFIGAGDFNNDGQSEIVVAFDDIDNIDVLVAYDIASFAKQMTYSTGSFPSFVAVGDFNNDNQLDIVVGNSNDKTVSVLLGYDNGSFATQTTFSTGGYPYAVAIDDFNSDARLDIVVANFHDSTISILLGYGDGSFADQTTYSTGSYPRSVAIGDFDNDTRLDIVVANFDGVTVPPLCDEVDIEQS